VDAPINPPVERGPLGDALPAYLANGLIGLRVRDLPLTPGMTLVAGFTGDHPVRETESAASAPYPLAGDLALNGVTLSQAQQQADLIDQAYDFSCGELTTRFGFVVGEARAQLTVLTFCSHESPSLVCQEIALEVSGASDVELTASVDAGSIAGQLLKARRDTPGEDAACDGWLLWESLGRRGTCGVAYVTELAGAEADARRPPWREQRLTSTYAFRGHAGRTYRLRTIAALVPSVVHPRPDEQAVRLVAHARERGFDRLRAANREAWGELWRGRIRLVGADERWQALTDAALFYLLSSTHPASPASTSIFGLATWRNYHYYYGHVMWDMETFCVPPLTLLEPLAARSLLDYRARCLPGAEGNARLRGRHGLQFPWESAPSSGHEAAPLPSRASWHEDHVTPDVARAFAFYAQVTGDSRFRREKAWPVLAGVAEWLTCRVLETSRGFEVKQSMGVAEREQAVDNPAYMNMVSAAVLRDAVETAEWLGVQPGESWRRIADGLRLPMREGRVVSHDGYRVNETKGATPDPLMGIFPLQAGLAPDVQARTLDDYLGRADEYLGSPMLSALYATWAARAGDRQLSARMMEEGYGKFMSGRFLQTLEYRPDVFPQQPQAGPFHANIGGFLSGLLLGLPGLEPGAGSPGDWARHPVVLPADWHSIEVDRLWVRGRSARLRARQGAERSELAFAS
jgi:trehalose/maltose hydrolase-like predicted phosphorylase